MALCDVRGVVRKALACGGAAAMPSTRSNNLHVQSVAGVRECKTIHSCRPGCQVNIKGDSVVTERSKVSVKRRGRSPEVPPCQACPSSVLPEHGTVDVIHKTSPHLFASHLHIIPSQNSLACVNGKRTTQDSEKRALATIQTARPPHPPSPLHSTPLHTRAFLIGSSSSTLHQTRAYNRCLRDHRRSSIFDGPKALAQGVASEKCPRARDETAHHDVRHAPRSCKGRCPGYVSVLSSLLHLDVVRSAVATACTWSNAVP
ncbi:hypothetical protein T440DRAFT_479843 [Plenodomus tracheiphilus IPT5]|uniref:Uncharacterized protein n=1 Tax=Plenodomus tracheiphilus IPT5 TaxID=1408161 RepID=A0A6A7B2C4_9PLEO|nr:hypothetical protein T440DRAFT_479843 [Plenodomus tracheiphilus IPT5]